MVGIRLIKKSKSPPMGERLVVKSPCSMAAVHFRKRASSYVAYKLKTHLEFRMVKCPTIGVDFQIKSGQYPPPPTNPLVSLGGG